MVGKVGNQGDLGKIYLRGQVSIKPGDYIVPVTLRSTAGRDVDLAIAAGNSHVVLFFYSGDREGFRYPELAGCTPEACSFRDHLSRLHALGAVVFGVSLQPPERQQQFVEREHLTFELLSDEQQQLVEAFDIPLWISETGEAFSSRTTVIVEKGGRIAHVAENVDPKRHIEAVIEVMQRLLRAQRRPSL